MTEPKVTEEDLKEAIRLSTIQEENRGIIIPQYRNLHENNERAADFHSSSGM